jgi:hypothetical protein
MEVEAGQQKKCGCPCHKMGGVVVVLIGVIFLLGNLDIISSKIIGIIWPIFIILAGIKIMAKRMCKCCDKT